MVAGPFAWLFFNRSVSKCVALGNVMYLGHVGGTWISAHPCQAPQKLKWNVSPFTSFSQEKPNFMQDISKNALYCIKNSSVNFSRSASLNFEAICQNGFGIASLRWLTIFLLLKKPLEANRNPCLRLLVLGELGLQRNSALILNLGHLLSLFFPFCKHS